MRLFLFAQALLVVTGCTGPDPLRPGDIACFDNLMGNEIMGNMPYWKARELCAPNRLPDLTGDERVQKAALADGTPFQVQPHLDARLKFVRRWEDIGIGTSIPDSYKTYIPKIIVEEHDTKAPGGGPLTSTPAAAH